MVHFPIWYFSAKITIKVIQILVCFKILLHNFGLTSDIGWGMYTAKSVSNEYDGHICRVVIFSINRGYLLSAITKTLLLSTLKSCTAL